MTDPLKSLIKELLLDSLRYEQSPEPEIRLLVHRAGSDPEAAIEAFSLFLYYLEAEQAQAPEALRCWFTEAARRVADRLREDSQFQRALLGLAPEAPSPRARPASEPVPGTPPENDRISSAVQGEVSDRQIVLMADELLREVRTAEELRSVVTSIASAMNTQNVWRLNLETIDLTYDPRARSYGARTAAGIRTADSPQALGAALARAARFPSRTATREELPHQRSSRPIPRRGEASPDG